MWICEWCEYPNENMQRYVCEMCGERSELHTPPVPPVVIEPIKPPEQIAAPIPEHKEYNRKSPVVESLPKIAWKAALMDAQLLIKDQNTTSEPTVSTATMHMVEQARESQADTSSSDHICFMDLDSINCIICSKPMIFMTTAYLKYPDWLPNETTEKIKLINETLNNNVRHYYNLFVTINGGEIPGMTEHMERSNVATLEKITYDECKFPMMISIMCTDWSNPLYHGPTINSLAAACTYAFIQKRHVVLPINIINSNDEEILYLLLITRPEQSSSRIGKIRLINPMFEPSSIVVEALIQFIVDEMSIAMSDSDIYWLFLTREEWIQECDTNTKLMYTLVNVQLPLSWLRTTQLKAIVALTVASVLGSGMSLPSALKIFSSFQYIGNTLDFINVGIDRIIMFLFRDAI